MSVQAKLTGVEATKHFTLTDAPPTVATDPKALTIKPETLRVHIENGAVVMVSVTGLVQRRDAKRGTQRMAVWTAAERWHGMPLWVLDIITSTGAVLRSKA